MYGIDTSCDKSCDFDLVSLTSRLTLTAKFSLTIDKIYFVITIATTTSMLHCLPNCFRYLSDDDEFGYRFDVTLSKPPALSPEKYLKRLL
jgi:hypothetical protein